MREAINTVGDRLGLPVGWLNTGFVNTNSYTPRLAEHRESGIIFVVLDSFHRMIHMKGFEVITGSLFNAASSRGFIAVTRS